MQATTAEDSRLSALRASRRTVGAIATGVAAAANLVVLLLAAGPGDVAMRADSNGQIMEINAGMVVGVTILAGVVATLAAAVLDRVRYGRTLFVALGTTATLASLGGALGGVTTGTKVTLGALHLITGAVIVGALGSRPERSRHDGARR